MKVGWTTAALGDVADIQRRGVDPTSIADDTAYLGLEHIESGGRIIGMSTIRESAVASTKFRFGPEHILFGKLRPYLAKIAAPDFPGVCSTDILPIRPKAQLDAGYLKHFLRQPVIVDLASARATGANLPRLSPSELARFELPLPPIEEQRRIATILDHVAIVRDRSVEGLN
ncbi:MAG: restriction endonuclease subunit S, partial [Nocardioides sp.]